jgi:hypothetical protein
MCPVQIRTNVLLNRKKIIRKIICIPDEARMWLANHSIPLIEMVAKD